MEAKCYDLTNGAGVKHTSHLISKLRSYSFGILVVTNYLDTQAYRELLEDKHPILIITGKDIIDILTHSRIDNNNLLEFLSNIPNY